MYRIDWFDNGTPCHINVTDQDLPNVLPWICGFSMFVTVERFEEIPSEFEVGLSRLMAELAHPSNGGGQ